MESENSIYIILNDGKCYTIESKHFCRNFTLENFDTARTWKAYSKNRDNKIEYDVNWTAQKVCLL